MLAAKLAQLYHVCFNQPKRLPQLFWVLHTSALSVPLGVAKIRPIAVGNTRRRLFGSVFTRLHKSYITALCEEVGQFGVGTSGGVEIVGLLGQLLHEGGAWQVSVDGVNAFNSILRAAFLPAVAMLLPKAYDYLVATYGTVVPPLLAIAIWELLRRLRDRYGPEGISLRALMDDISIILRSRASH